MAYVIRVQILGYHITRAPRAGSRWEPMADKEKTGKSKVTSKKSPTKKKVSQAKKTAYTKVKPKKKAPSKSSSQKKSSKKRLKPSTETTSQANLPEQTALVPATDNTPAVVEQHTPEQKYEKPTWFERIMGRGKAIDLIEGEESEEQEEVDPEALARGDEPMSLVGHLDEIRTRLMYILGSMFFVLCVTFYFSDPIVDYITKPFLATGFKLNIFKITGGFMLKLKASMIVALLIGIPLIVYHIWQFIKPAVSTKERKFARIVIVATILLFYGGVCFVFYLFIPTALKIMLDFIGPNMLPMIGAEDYFGFLIFFCIAMGILFELPIFILILTKIGLITPQFLTSKRKYAIVAMWVLAAVITPQPDMISQSMVAIPLMVLYEISIIISRIVYRNKQRELLGTS